MIQMRLNQINNNYILKLIYENMNTCEGVYVFTVKDFWVVIFLSNFLSQIQQFNKILICFSSFTDIPIKSKPITLHAINIV